MKNGAYYYFSIESDLDFSTGTTNPHIFDFRGELDFNNHRLDGLSFTRLTELIGTQYTALIEDCYGGAIRNLEYRPVGQCNLVLRLGLEKPDNEAIEFIFENITAGDKDNPLTFKVGNNGGNFLSIAYGPNTKVTFKNCTNYCNINLLAGNHVGIFLNGYADDNVEVIFDNCDNYGTFQGADIGFLIGNDAGITKNGYTSITATGCENFGEIYATNSCGFIGLNDSLYTNLFTGSFEGADANKKGTIIKLEPLTADITTESDNTIKISNLNTSAYSQFEISGSGYADLIQDGVNRGTLSVSVSTGKRPISEIADLSFKKLGFVDEEFVSEGTSENDKYGNSIVTLDGVEYYSLDLSARDTNKFSVEFNNSTHTRELNDISYSLYAYDKNGNLAGSKTF